MKNEEQMTDNLKGNGVLPCVVRWLIILGSCILIALIWLLLIPWTIIITLPTGKFMHEFDIVMQPYYWLNIAWNNKRI